MYVVALSYLEDKSTMILFKELAGRILVTLTIIKQSSRIECPAFSMKHNEYLSK